MLRSFRSARSVALLALAFSLVAAPPASAQTRADSAVHRAVKSATDSIRLRVLPGIAQLCATKNAPKYVQPACDELPRHTTQLARADSTFLAAWVQQPTPPPPPPVVGPSTLVSDTIARVTFDDGTLGNLTASATDVTVVPDPTNSGHGKVVAMHYVRQSTESPGVNVDRNRFVGLEYPRGVGLGEKIVFEGDLYLPANIFNVLPEPQQRKLLYWQRDQAGDGPTGNGYFAFVLNSWGPGISIVNAYIPLSGVVDEQHGGSDLARLAPGRWQHIKYEVQMNSSLAAKDGVVRLTLDGVRAYENTALSVTDPGWNVDPTKLRLRFFLIGDQLNSDQPYDEWRYWDNVVLVHTHPTLTSQRRLKVKKP